MFSSCPSAALVAGVKMGSGQAFALAQPSGERDAAGGAGCLVLLPSAAGQVAARHALHLHHARGAADHGAAGKHRALCAVEACDRRDVGGHQVIGHDSKRTQEAEPADADGGEQLALAGHRRRHHHVEGADAVGGHHQELRCLARHRRELVDVADLALAAAAEGQVGLEDRVDRCIAAMEGAHRGAS